jgi:drug/metabolite transporter (DMT)-like permease
MVGGFVLQAEGLRTTSAGSSAFLTCAGTLLTAFWAWLLLRQRPGARLLAGIAIALAGSALLSLDAGLRLGRGELLTLAGAALFALQIVAVSRWVSVADPVALVCVQSFVAAAILTPFVGPPAVLFAALFAAPTSATLWNFVYLAVAGSTIAPLLQVLAQRTLPAGPHRAAVRAGAGVRAGVRADARRGALCDALVARRGAHPGRGAAGGVARRGVTAHGLAGGSASQL